MPNVTVDQDKCDGDGICADVCPVNVFDIIDDKSQPNRMEDCIMCLACVSACPTEAITVED